MSTLKVNTIQDASGGNASTSEQIAQGRAKVWINFNGSGTVAIRDSFNVSSITDNGTGDYTITYSNARPDVNYAVAYGWNIEAVNNRVLGTDSSNYLTGSMNLTIEDAGQSYGQGSSRADCNRITVVIFGD